MDRAMNHRKMHLINPLIFFALVGLYLTSLYSFLLFHTLAEFFSALVAFSLFTISWNARRFLPGNYLVLLGVAYLCVGGIDILHTLSFKGMGVFPGSSNDLPTQLWIAARYMQAFSLLAIPLFIDKIVNHNRTSAMYFIMSSLLIASIFYGVFPNCYIDGVGLTAFKQASEYLICAILLIAIMLMLRKRDAFDPFIFNLLIASMIVTIASELSLVSYTTVYGIRGIVGHILKVLAFYLLYRAIVVTSITNPYESLFRDLNQSRERLRLFIEHAPVSLAMFDDQMRYLSVSRRWLNEYGLAGRDLIGMSHYEVFPEIPERWREVHRRGLAGEVVRAEDDRFIRADGSVQWLRWEIRPWSDAEDRIAGIVIFTEDITERKEAEEELLRRGERLQLAHEAAKAGAWEWDLRTGENVWSQELWRLFDLEPGSCKPSYEAWMETIHPEDRPHAEFAARESVQNGTVLDAEWRVRTCDGTERWIMLRGQPQRDADGKVVRFLGIAMDITDRKRAERDLRESQSRLDLALRSAHMGVWHWDIVEDRRWLDDHAYRLLGIEPDNFTGDADGFFNAVHPDDRLAVRESLDRTIEREGPYENEYRVVHPDGSIHHIASRGRVVRDVHSRPVRLNGIIWDITDRKKMEEEQALLFELAQRRSAETEAVYEAINEAVLIYDTNLRVVRVNSTFKPTYGFNPVGLTVKEIVSLIQCERADRRPLILEEQPTPRALSGESALNQSYLITRPDGVRMAIETSSGPLRSGDRIVGTVTVWHDITERKRMEEDLLRSRNELEVRVEERTAELRMTNRALKEYAVKLERLNEELRDFAFIASHDLQEPVRKLQVFGDMLTRMTHQNLDEEGKDCVMRMGRSARQLGALVQSLQDYSRLTARFGPTEEVDLAGIVRGIKEEFQAEMERSGGRIEVGSLPVLEADEAQIGSLLRHLIGNSIKFAKHDVSPVIRVYGQEGKDHFTIVVEDNGIGFDEDYLDRIFRPFQQLHDRKGQYGGTGMGLAVCRKIAELHDGTLTARSIPGIGSIFTVSLPIRKSREGLIR